jgi:hypothetical protein
MKQVQRNVKRQNPATEQQHIMMMMVGVSQGLTQVAFIEPKRPRKLVPHEPLVPSATATQLEQAGS